MVEDVGDIARAKLQADRGSPISDQLAFAEFLECGAFDGHLRRTRQILNSRDAQNVPAGRQRTEDRGEIEELARLSPRRSAGIQFDINCIH